MGYARSNARATNPSRFLPHYGSRSTLRWLSVISLFVLVFAVIVPSDSAVKLSNEELGSGTPHTSIADASSQVLSSEFSQKRGAFVGADFNAKDLHDAYKEIQSGYYDKAFSSAEQAKWRILTKRDDVEVAIMEHPDDPNCPYVRMTAVIPTSVEDCWEFLQLKHWDKTMPKMDPFYEGIELYGEFTYKKVHMILARKRTQRILAFEKRDFVFLGVSDEPLQDGTWVSGTVSVRTPKVPRRQGYTRAFQDSIAFYKPLEGNTKTKVTIVCRIDLNDSSEGGGGMIPMWLYVKTIGATGARSVMSMRNVLVQEKTKKDAARQAVDERESNHDSFDKPSDGHKKGLPRRWWGKGSDHERDVPEEIVHCPQKRKFLKRIFGKG